MSVLTTCILLAVSLNVVPNKVEAHIVNIEQVYPTNELNWFITREMWQATKYNGTKIEDDYLPSKIVIIAHTVRPKCYSLKQCSAQMRSLQSEYGFPYNFVIGNDGRVYEGRGWNTVGAHSRGYNFCSIGLAFTGDYRTDKVSALQQLRAQLLFTQGVKLGYLHTGFHVVGHSDLRPTESPGTNLYNVIRKWPRYDRENRYKDRTCSQIHGLSQN